MTDDPLQYIPAFISPLTDAEHARLGRIVVLWGQVEHFVEQLLCRVSGLSWKELEALQITERPMGAKTNFMSIARKRLGDATLEAKVQLFCELINETKVARNHAMHGMWGWRANSRNRSVEPCARRTADPKQPMKTAQLAALEKKLCRISRIGSDLTAHFDGHNVRAKYGRFIHHADKERPAWLREWSSRNPLDCAVLDRSTRGGKLPRLSSPFPRK
jgi:hypothetical protein